MREQDEQDELELEKSPDQPGGPWDMSRDPNRTLSASAPEDTYRVELEHRFCVLECRHPWPGQAKFQCPSCHGRVIIEQKEAPEPSRIGVFIGVWLRAFRDARDTLRWKEPATVHERWFVAAGQVAHWTITQN